MVLNSDFQEFSLLGRSEWIKFISLFFNQEDVAETEYDHDEELYRQFAAEARFATPKPTVFVNVPTQNIWFHAGGASFVSQLIEDAGAVYWLDADTNTGSVQFSINQTIPLVKNLDYWINLGSSNTINDLLLLNPAYQDFKAVTNGKVFNNNRRMGRYGSNDYWETGIVEPALLLKDLVKIFHPELVPDHEFIWYQQLQLYQTPSPPPEVILVNPSNQSPGVIAAIIVGVLLLVSLVGLAALYIKKRQDIKRYEKLLAETASNRFDVEDRKQVGK